MSEEKNDNEIVESVEEEQQPDEIASQEWRTSEGLPPGGVESERPEEAWDEPLETEADMVEPQSKRPSKIDSVFVPEMPPSRKSSNRIEFQAVERKRRPNPRVQLLFAAIIGVGLIFAVGYLIGAQNIPFFGSRESRALRDASTKKKQDKKPEKKEEAAIQIDKASIKIDVLNGNGIPGESAAIANVLKQSGFNVLKAENADNHNYSQTLLRCKPGSDDAAKLVAKDISTFYPALVKQDLQEDSESDIVVVLGKDKKAAPADRGSVNIRILNGNGKRGSAQEIAEILKKNGFQIKETRNADKFDYPETVISYKPGQKDLAKQIAKDIAGKYTANLKEDASLDIDIAILLGLK